MENNEKNAAAEAHPARTPNAGDDRSPCEDCWMGEYKEIGYRYCGNTKCPLMPGAGN